MEGAFWLRVVCDQPSNFRTYPNGGNTMVRKIAILTVLTLSLSAPLFLAGCQTAAAPNAVTGTMSAADKAHYTDDKGRFHADLAAQQRPLR